MPSISTKDMACHTWAISGTPENGEDVNKKYVKAMDKHGAKYNYGEGLNAKKLAEARAAAMVVIQGLCEARTDATDHNVFVCGGFREGQVCPEHLWLEDHTDKKTYDTFINQLVRVVKRVGKPGKEFQPGCEASPFLASEIARVQVNGYTAGQAGSLPK